MLTSLPKLQPRRTTFCNQHVMDACVAYIERARQDLLYELLREEGAHHTHEYYEVAWKIVAELAEANYAVPDEPVGKLDLAIEISRRLRAANGMDEFPVQGRPLAADPENLPPFISLPIDEGTARRGKLTQEQVDRILARTYQQRPELWFALAEEYRNDLLMSATSDFLLLMGQIVAAEFPENERLWKPGELRLEAVRRIYEMCRFGERYTSLTGDESR
jgi:hypothetical protein